MQLEDETESISFQQIVGLIKRNWLFLALMTAVFSILTFLIADYLPHFYKSRAVLSIQSSYFQHPLVSDLISEVQESSEMNGQRQSILRLALDDDFLDEIGEKFDLYEHPADSVLRPLDRELLLKKIEYFSVTPSSFQISMTTRSPESSFEITKSILNQMTYTLTERRFQILVKARDSILKQAKLLKSTLGDSASIQQVALEEQLSKMESNLAALRSKFTESHPDVIVARGRVNALNAQLRNKQPSTSPAANDDYTSVFLSPASRASTQEIFNDLLKKLSHLNIVLEMEKDRDTVSYLDVIEKPSMPINPIFPNHLQMLAFGALAGFLLAAIQIAYQEFKRAQILSPEQAASAFGFELLGELPPFISPEPSLLLGMTKAPVMALPNAGKET